MRSVSIIIPNWNGKDLLRSYLPSVLAAAAQYGGQAEIVVVDDGSSDGSVDMLHRKFFGVKVIAHRHNKGFGRACWSGAAATGQAVLIFLNSDVSVEPDFIEPLVNYFEDPSVFAVSPLIFNDNGTLSDVTISIPYLRRAKIRYRPFPVDCLLAKNAVLAQPWVTLFPIGGAFAVDRRRFMQLQGFDDLFAPFYYEDTDLGFRAWRRGWKCIVAPGSRVTHFHRGTIARTFSQYKVRAIRKRNRLLFHWKNFTSPGLLRRHLLMQLLRLCYRPFCLDTMIVVATAFALGSFGKAMDRRRVEQRYTVCSEEEIFRMIAAANDKNRRMIPTHAASFRGVSKVQEGN